MMKHYTKVPSTYFYIKKYYIYPLIRKLASGLAQLIRGKKEKNKLSEMRGVRK